MIQLTLEFKFQCINILLVIKIIYDFNPDPTWHSSISNSVYLFEHITFLLI
jgi:hypothetical protein